MSSSISCSSPSCCLTARACEMHCASVVLWADSTVSHSASSSAIALPLSSSFDGENFGWIIDTPGVRSFGIAHVQPSRVISAFPEFTKAISHCPKNCSHNEATCALNDWPGFTNQNLARLESLRRVLSVK